MCEPLVSEPGFALPNKVVAVAVDRDVNSKYAVKWAVSYLFPNKNKHNHASLILVHVKKQNYQTMNGTSPDGRGESCDDVDTSELFKAFRAYSSRKGIQVKEVVIDGNDVSKALLDYINDKIITNIVFGASTRNPLQKQSGNHDIPMLVNEFAPAFCSVYVISETEIQFIRPAAVPAASFSSLSDAPYYETVASQFQQDHSEPEDGRDMVITQQMRSKRSEGRILKNRSTNLSMDTIDTLFTGNKIFSSRHCLVNHKNLPEKQIFELIDNTAQNVNSSSPDSRNGEVQSLPLKDMKAEIRRMKVELKQTRGMYNKVCEKMVTAKKKAKDIKKWELYEAHRLAHARLVREAAFALVKKERAKGEAATEAAVKAQKVATMEVERRKYAELKIKKEAEAKNRALNALSNDKVSYRKYTAEEIEVATDYFSDSLKIGEGGYGPVYEGRLYLTRVAIKVLRSGDAKRRKQFQQEVPDMQVEVLSRMRHPNMVLLIGACPQYGCLVYEYMNNGSLEDRLFRKGNTRPMSWGLRFKVAAELATGLSFLHSARPEPLVHRDLKPANVLLNRTYECKISDFGLSRLVPAPVTDSMTASYMTSAAGTSWYIDPEYQQTGNLDVKSDVYSFGIILLQILTARPPMGLIHKVEKSIIEGTFADLLDPAVPRWPIEEALTLAKIALQCVELKKKYRPDLCSVVLPELNRLKEFGGIIN